jgi:hypothetical protein
VVRLPDRSQTGARVLGDSHSLIDPGLLPDRDHLAPLYRRQQAYRAAGFHRGAL